MPVYPGTDGPIFEQAGVLERDGYEEKRIIIHTHNGTHVDAPRHLIKGGMCLDEFQMEAFMGRGVVLDFSGFDNGTISGSDLLEREYSIIGNEFVLLYTGWDKYWGSEQYYHGYPVLSPEAVDYLLDNFQLKGVGGDFISMDAPGRQLKNHTAFLGKGILIVENLMNLHLLLNRPFSFICLPLKLEDSDGAPARAAAVLDW